uniref:Uncharacterized protein n=1 Tax=Compsopogon caeruleus TaxID=31354 RepID=A0A7S1XF92_9RHOD
MDGKRSASELSDAEMGVAVRRKLEGLLDDDDVEGYQRAQLGDMIRELREGLARERGHSRELASRLAAYVELADTWQEVMGGIPGGGDHDAKKTMENCRSPEDKLRVQLRQLAGESFSRSHQLDSDTNFDSYQLLKEENTSLKIQLKHAEDDRENTEHRYALVRNQFVNRRLRYANTHEAATEAKAKVPAEPVSLKSSPSPVQPGDDDHPRSEGQDLVVDVLKAKISFLEKQAQKDMEEKRRLSEENDMLKMTQRSPPSFAAVVASPVFSAMEISFQHLLSEQEQWRVEREELRKGHDLEVANLTANLSNLQNEMDRKVSLYESHLVEATKMAEASKASRDRLSLQYESKRLDSTTEEQLDRSKRELSLSHSKIRRLEERVGRLDRECKEQQEYCARVENLWKSQVRNCPVLYSSITRKDATCYYCSRDLVKGL